MGGIGGLWRRCLFAELFEALVEKGVGTRVVMMSVACWWLMWTGVNLPSCYF